MVTQTYNEMSSKEFDTLASDFIGGEYYFDCEYMAENGACYAFSVSEEDVAREFDEWEVENTAPIYILTRMVKAGILPLGKYLIKVNW